MDILRTVKVLHASSTHCVTVESYLIRSECLNSWFKFIFQRDHIRQPHKSLYSRIYISRSPISAHVWISIPISNGKSGIFEL